MYFQGFMVIVLFNYPTQFDDYSSNTFFLSFLFMHQELWWFLSILW